MVTIRPSHFCCGCLSLLIGIEFICLSHLLWCVGSVATASSAESIFFFGVKISPTTQVFNAAWSLAGIPLIIGAGVGMLYRIEYQLRMYFWYSLATFFINVTWGLSFLFSGDLCKTIVGKEVQTMGTAFVCGFTDTFVFFWMLMGILINLYCVYIIWSAAEECGSSSYPELMKYSTALKSHLLPLPTGGAKEEKKVLKVEEKPNKDAGYIQAPVYGSIPPATDHHQQHHHRYHHQPVSMPPPMTTSMPVGMPMTSYSMPPTAPGNPGSTPFASMGTPQSFVPGPQSSGAGGYY